MKRYVYAEPKKTNQSQNRQLDLYDKLATQWAMRAEKLVKTAASTSAK